MPRLLDLLSELGVCGTFFVTGEMARRHPAIIARVVRDGHELGCHGDLHRDFTTLSPSDARDELRISLATLRSFARVVSFRAPYLRFPAAYLPLLPEQGLQVDSSTAHYKFGSDQRHAHTVPGLVRVPASVTSSVLRLPAAVRRRWLAAAKRPLVLFVHPWEAVDFRKSRLRWDCRFRTGDIAVACWREVIGAQQRSGARFRPLCELAGVCA
jgi:peptidoglycan-N-acetylglucosamine deacetylase